MLQENINVNKYNSHIETLYGHLKHMIDNEDALNNVVQIERNKETKQIESMVVNARANVNERFRWKNGKRGKIVGVLSCEEIIEFAGDGTFKHTLYTFHFEAESSSDVKTFRVDYKPIQETPLHAHWYIDMKKHLTFPHETSLDIAHIDFCTIMLVISYYIKHKDKYPLTNGSDYNSRIMNKRRRYDDVYRKH